ncbi:MBOAT family O-acyltransferase [Aliibacillus thermotolerans]|uniref:MBOAT family O-acyltransferase n=1 Tax=Aliibacillus thermotolerans TaxID=1834418 RepID=A0ABW0U8L8_9BACI|nr:MBOAT family protein [Aliibacillus thermotolerans]MDA3130682.1 MBOAT family protein [Aliibacillus thermotolerans]
MLFNSHVFIFGFLPIVFIVYFIFRKIDLVAGAKIWLVFSSLFFYSWWNPVYLPILLGSIITNFLFGKTIEKVSYKKIILTIGIIFNVALLGYFKYVDFFIANVNMIFETNFSLLHVALPLAISFFTFQQIAYLVDTYKGEAKKYSFLNYALFVTFFPQLIAGPIVHHKEMMPQFETLSARFVRAKNVVLGSFIFFIGLFKKTVIADTFAIYASDGFGRPETLTLIEGWIVSLSYSFQIYFDFSAYSDMAIGLALLFNIKLPINFNSPYKALNIQDFWRRWHMTLGRFLTKYIYIPLGGNRISESRTLFNIMIVFGISGFWHGAGWTFVVWGLLHGVASVIHRLWRKLAIDMPKWLAWFITFQFVNVAWVFFRAESFQDALHVLKAMVGLQGISIPPYLESLFQQIQVIPYEVTERFFVGDLYEFHKIIVLLIVFLFISVFAKNSIERLQSFRPNWKTALFIGFVTVVSILHLTRVSEFIYFNF